MFAGIELSMKGGRKVFSDTSLLEKVMPFWQAVNNATTLTNADVAIVHDMVFCVRVSMFNL